MYWLFIDGKWCVPLHYFIPWKENLTTIKLKRLYGTRNCFGCFHGLPTSTMIWKPVSFPAKYPKCCKRPEIEIDITKLKVITDSRTYCEKQTGQCCLSSVQVYEKYLLLFSFIRNFLMHIRFNITQGLYSFFRRFNTLLAKNSKFILILPKVKNIAQTKQLTGNDNYWRTEPNFALISLDKNIWGSRGIKEV